MDFAPEPVLDAFTPPPTRSALRAPPADDNGQTFDDHLEAVSEPATERPVPARNKAKNEAPVESTAAEGDEAIDADAALLGGPLPPAPPPMAAPVMVQIAVSQPEAQQGQAPPEHADADIAPVTAPQAPAPIAAETEAASAEPVAASAPVASKRAQAEVKPATPDDGPQAQAQAQNTQQTQSAPQLPQRPSAVASIEIQEVPEAVRQAIASTIAPAPQAVTQAAQRAARSTSQTNDSEGVVTKDGKSETTAPTTNAKAPVPKATAGGAGNVVIDATPPQTSISAPDASQVAQSNAITTTASQASTHVQHTAIDTGAQRAAPADAQVGREIIRRFDGGNASFELRLDPAELGRVDVRMEVTRDHRVTAVITADNPQALTELARHARDLEQQLQSAGLQLSENGLSFGLRQGAHGGDTDEANNGPRSGEDAPTEQQPAPVARPIGYERWRGVRVDMMV